MRSTRSSTRSVWLICTLFFWTASHEPAGADEKTDAPFWLTPKVHLEPRSLSPASAELIAGPDGTRRFVLLQTGDTAPSANFVPTNPLLEPFIQNEDAGYRLVAGGLKEGARPYGDRKYKIQNLDAKFSGLTLLQTRMGHKAILDGRYSVVVAVAKPSYVFVAIDDRALETYKRHGVPSWLQEFAPTGRKVVTDDPLMANVGASYLVFVRKAPAGRIAFGPPSMDVRHNAMYFAFFADAE